ncbi:uncharacterized protein EAF02_009173 [Botrytis sinoallii]|uniref:uncharacterized protein n=1 Tax=Botrytis sinoallii TaxID=1463999 RepID=UPI00190140B4|nr:uncharacterized protein EAF02_009173 [Botrytis sinoallii]KAF7872068.1 hypothetical protein EAF02_009173 [Botrytis sinoallii]
MPSAITVSAIDTESAICSVESSVQTVFAIPELLELILLQLPFLDLVRAQMINPNFMMLSNPQTYYNKLCFFVHLQLHHFHDPILSFNLVITLSS